MGVGWGWGGGCLVRLRGGGGGGGWRSVVPEPHRGSHCVSGLRAMQGGQVGRRRTAQFQQRPDGHGCFACWGCRCSLGMQLQPRDAKRSPLGGGGALTLTLYVSLVRFLSCRHLHWPPPASCRPGSMLQCRTAHHAPPACFPFRFPCAGMALANPGKLLYREDAEIVLPPIYHSSHARPWEWCPRPD